MTILDNAITRRGRCAAVGHVGRRRGARRQRRGRVGAGRLPVEAGHHRRAVRRRQCLRPDGALPGRAPAGRDRPAVHRRRQAGRNRRHRGVVRGASPGRWLHDPVRRQLHARGQRAPVQEAAVRPGGRLRAGDHAGDDPAGAGGVADPGRERPARADRAGQEPARQAQLRQLQRHRPRGQRGVPPDGRHRRGARAVPHVGAGDHRSHRRPAAVHDHRRGARHRAVARRQGAGAGRHLGAPRAERGRLADHRRGGPAGLRVQCLAGPVRAGAHAARGGEAAVGPHQRGGAQPGHARATWPTCTPSRSRATPSRCASWSSATPRAGAS